MDGFGRIPRFVTAALPDIGPHAISVYVVLADACNGDRYCAPSHRTIQRLTGCSPCTVTSALRRLEAVGFIMDTNVTIVQRQKTNKRVVIVR